MKKKFFIFSLSVASLALVNKANAQLSTGGAPLSILKGLTLNEPKTHIYYNPVTEESISSINSDTTKMLTYVALMSETDLKFPESGEFHYTDDGTVIWKAKFTIPDALAIGMYFDNFVLPKGVSMYATNANGKQILGAYTIENNSQEDTKFATEPIQGSTVNIELNINPSVDFNNIHFSMNQAAVYFTSISYLAKYVTGDILIDQDRYRLEGSSSTCMIEAKCAPDKYTTSLNASLQTLYVAGGGLSMCSASMINNTGNSSSTCKQYVLTASHCQSNRLGTGDTTNTAFSQTLFRYNFQKTTCTSTFPAEVSTLSGANFRARSPYDNSKTINELGGDFLLLELRTRVPEAWGAVLGGWDINDQFNYLPSTGSRYTGFHHPAGDIKKTSWTRDLRRDNSYFSQQFAADVSQGGIARGSSGSSLFNDDNKIIGIASTAGNDDPTCGGGFTNSLYPDFLLYINYYRISHAWEFHTAPSRQLKVWLDPANTGKTIMASATNNCVPIDGTSINESSNEFDNAINIYPNPSTGLLNLKINLNEASDISIEVYNTVGARVNSYSIANATNVVKEIDLSHLNSGVYLVKLSDGTNISTKKVTISK